MALSSKSGASPDAALRFYVTPKQRISPGVVLLAIGLAVGLLLGTREVLSRARVGRRAERNEAARGSRGAGGEDKDEDLSTVETIYLGDPGEAPVPVRPDAKPPGGQGGSVHPFVIVRLPRFGAEAGLIPDTGAGRLLFGWLAGFNQANAGLLARALPNRANDAAVAAQLELRRQTGGFRLLSSKEVQPGVLVFRLREQDPAATEVLGTLQVLQDSDPPAIESFSIRAVPQATAKGEAATLPGEGWQ